MSRRFLATLFTTLIVLVIAAGAVFLAKGYRFSPRSGMISGTGILSVNSKPDQASVYLDDHLTTATDDTINSLSPKKYKVKIVKDGFITWEKEVEVNQGLVTEIKATLFRSIPTIYPVTYSGVEQAVLSPDGQKLVYSVPSNALNDNSPTAKKSGLWVWEMATTSFSLGRGTEPRQIALNTGFDFSKAQLRWSPDSRQILASFPDKYVLLEADRLNDSPRDITAVIGATLNSWTGESKTALASRLEAIKDSSLRQVASSSAYIRWSSDETKFVYCASGCEKPKDPEVDQNIIKTSQNASFKAVDLVTQKTFDLPTADYYIWLPSDEESEHLVMVETEKKPTEVSNELDESKIKEAVVNRFVAGKISIIEFDGSNKAEVYAGSFEPQSVFVWPDGFRLLIISSFPTATASKPNIFGVNLK